jgi:ActR/RegA family two-component response regulator
MLDAGVSLSATARELGVSRQTLRRALLKKVSDPAPGNGQSAYV